ncbi:MAG TPA: mechanosensitive ion channel family protein, partial [Rhizomicrobium sp.]|nr:mechanosensitive ion channel family protein [Rhizomicrobium sp.]
DEVIEIASLSTGKVFVREIGLFRTLVATRDNVQLSVPNSNIFTNVITNYTREPTVRISFEVPVDRGNDVGKAETLIVEALKSDSRVLSTPAPLSGIVQIQEYSVVMLARCWVKNSDQYRAPFDLKKIVNDKLRVAKILIPVPRQAVAERIESPPTPKTE